MSADTHIVELLPAYALDCLDAGETQRVATHLATCATCRAELRAYEAVVDHLALAAPPMAASAGIKDRLMEQVRSPGTTEAPQRRVPWWRSPLSLFPRSTRAWSLVSLLLVVALSVSTVWLWQRLSQSRLLQAPEGWRTVALAGTDVAPNATGTLVISHDGKYGTLVVDDLPVLTEGYQYQLWLIRDGQRTSGGVFAVNDEGYGALWIASPEPLSSYPAFGITIEPAGGSPSPTGEKVLGGSL